MIEIIVWSFGMFSMAATAWLQDRRDRREEDTRYKGLKRDFEQRIADLEGCVVDLRKEIELLEKQSEERT